MSSRMEKLIGLRKRAAESEGPTLLEQYTTSAVGRGITDATQTIIDNVPFTTGSYDKAYPSFKNLTAEKLVELIEEDLARIMYNKDNNGVLLIEAAAYQLAQKYKYTTSTLWEKIKNKKEKNSLEELLESDESGLYQKVKTAMAGATDTKEVSKVPKISSDSVHTLKNDTNNFVEVYQSNKKIKKLESNTSMYLDTKKDTILYLDGLEVNEKKFAANQLLPDNTSKISDIYGIKSLDSSKRRSGGESKSPQATSGEILINPEHRGLTGLADANSKDYVYNTAPDGTWADYSYKGGELKRLTKEYPNWAKFVAELNTYPTTGATKTAPAATTPTTAPTGAEAAKAPVPEGEAAGVQTRRVVSDAVVMNVAKVLTDVYGGATYAGRTVFRNEMGMVRKMMDQLNSTAQSLGVTIGSAEALAQIITPSIRPGLGRFGTANLDGLGERDMEKQYRTELNLIMTAVKNLFDRIKKSPAQLLNYQPNLRDAAIALKQKREGAKTPVAGTAPAATPAPSTAAAPATSAPTPAPATGGAPAANAASAEANDGSSFGKKSSQSSKFKKLAKLRRLRVRGQMEAATEPSARLGVSRIS